MPTTTSRRRAGAIVTSVFTVTSNDLGGTAELDQIRTTISAEWLNHYPSGSVMESAVAHGYTYEAQFKARPDVELAALANSVTQTLRHIASVVTSHGASIASARTTIR